MDKTQEKARQEEIRRKRVGDRGAMSQQVRLGRGAQQEGVTRVHVASLSSASAVGVCCASMHLCYPYHPAKRNVPMNCSALSAPSAPQDKQLRAIGFSGDGEKIKAGGSKAKKH